ncbi:MAG: NnrU family protein, partial [Gammaproteobacteria bacterium]|nr:NnrU family protein [Gammaproteobacteria bacterium]
MTIFITGLVLFLGIHSVSIVAAGWRERVVDRIGSRPWQAIYSIIALIGLVLLIRGYADLRGQTALIYQTPRWVYGLSTTVMLPVFPLLLAAYLPGMIQRATKHPMLVAVKLWAV